MSWIQIPVSTPSDALKLQSPLNTKKTIYLTNRIAPIPLNRLRTDCIICRRKKLFINKTYLLSWVIPIKCRLLLVGSKLARCKTLATFYALVLLNFKVESSFKPEPSLTLLVLSAIEPNLPINIHSTLSSLLRYLLEIRLVDPWA